MASTTTEWEFTADVASWINEILNRDIRPIFSRAKCEQRVVKSLKRRDLTLLDKNKSVVLTGEVKLPYRPDGGSPYNEKLVKDALSKAISAGSEYFFTWNVNECVLWRTFALETEQKDRKHRSWVVTNVSREKDLTHPITIKEIKQWLPTFLKEFAEILLGKIQIGLQSPDEKFIEILESALNMPINLTLEELVERYQNNRFKSRLDKWMREEQGWVISDEPKDVKDNLERASRFACYALVNKLVFYEALLKRYPKRLEKLNVPNHVDKGDDLRLHMERYFAIAKEETGDYETVFGEDHKEIGNLIPFYSDSAVVHWRDLIDQIHRFDFSKLDYEVIGNISERLLSPEERHKYGQYYTRPEVVDLINSFCIHRGDEKVMDPACGGGTFLVRAYVRKRNLAPARKHRELLLDLYGIDISHFSTHLTTINLATRDLIDDKNYPQIARSDFFDVRHNKPFLILPNNANGVKVKTKGMGKSQQREIEIPQLDAVVGNPPYVRQEDIPKSKRKGKKAKRGTKEYYASLIEEGWKSQGFKLSGRSDLHCYFWPHATTFIKEDGYLCLVTSSSWLDVEYGFRLQEWILKNFEIIAIFESIDEPWFVGARVVTAVTILRRQPDESSRMNNILRFVQLRRPIRQILASNGTTAEEMWAADGFRNEILGLKENTVNDLYRARVVRQGDLWDEGVKLGSILKGSEEGREEQNEGFESGRYYGGKWGVHLRAPDLWFEIIDRYRNNLATLGELVKIRRGITSGKDSFFYPIDNSSSELLKFREPKAFKNAHGIPRSKVKSGKIRLVLCGKGRGELRPIEAQYLEPEVHNLMEIDGYTASPKNCARQILLVGSPKSEYRGTKAFDYIKWGEKQAYHRGATCAARVTEKREWYDLTGRERGDLFWSKAHQYKHVIPLNEHDLQCNCNLYDVYVPDSQEKPVFAGILNSTLVTLSKHQYGRPVGVEGALKTEVVDVNMMLVPDPRNAKQEHIERVAKAFEELKKRKALYFLSERRLKEMAYTQKGKANELERLSDLCELDMEDRRELDDAVFEMLGVRSMERRQELIDNLYTYLRDFFERTRQKEEKAIENKKRTKRRGRARPREIAVQILKEITEKEPRWLRKYDPDFIDAKKPYDVFDLPEEGEAEEYSDLFVKHGVRFAKGRKTLKILETNTVGQASVTCLVARSGHRGLTRVPCEDEECGRVLEDYQAFLNKRSQRLWKLVEERSADEEIQEKIYDALMLLTNS